MSDTPSRTETSPRSFAGLDNEDAGVYLARFEELKRQARKHLGRKAQVSPGATGVAASALGSLIRDLEFNQIPLSDVDKYGYPMLWPLLLKYVERHCDNANKLYRAKKRNAAEVPLGPGADGERGIEPVDHRPSPEDQVVAKDLIERLCERLTPLDNEVLRGRLQVETLTQIAARANRSAAWVSSCLVHIRNVLQELISEGAPP
jgi:hypothetical protein